MCYRPTEHKSSLEIVSAAAGAQAYGMKPERYFSGVREDFLSQLDPCVHRYVLEIGCGYGDTGREALARGLCESYVGVELSDNAGRLAREGLTEVLIGDVETLDLPYEEQSLDAVLMSEVLEHLRDPWAVVRKVVTRLRPGALIVASSPCVCHWRVVWELLCGRFDYADIGVMDRTHLRWFTPATYRAMFEQAGVQVDSIRPMSQWGTLASAVICCTRRKWQHLFMRQICLIGHVK